MAGTYVYAMIAGQHQPDLDQLDLPDDWGRVTALSVNGLTAIVSKYRGPAFNKLSKVELLRYLAVHQQVIEHVMAAHPILPAKFGTVLSSDREVRVLLIRWRSQISDTLKTLGDAIEIEVAATWDLKHTFQEIAREPEVAALTASIAGQPAEETTATRIRIGKLVKEAVDNRRALYVQKLIHNLTSLVCDAQPNPLPVDELALNVAFLVKRAKLDEFYSHIHQLDRAFEGQLAFRCVGPLPPYNFAAVEILQPCAEEIDAARQLLGLEERASEAELNASYRRLAARCHPDANPGDPMASQRFADLAAAQSKLRDYIRGQRMSEGQANEDHHYRFDFTRAAIEAAPILTIKGSDSSPILGESRQDYAAVV